MSSERKLVDKNRVVERVAQPELSEGVGHTRMIGHRSYFKSATGPLLLYWVFCVALAALTLRDEITSWRVPEALASNWGWAVLAVVVMLISQVAYIIVARSNGRPLKPLAAVVFVAINGPLECFAFLAFYKIFFVAAQFVFGNLNIVNFIFGFFGFVLYSGLIHGLFWARLIPPHFSDNPRLQPLRKRLTPIQACIVLSWCIYFYFTGDIWTLVALHVVMDIVLVVRVRPPLFGKVV